jgi:hypothetical protein
MTEIVQKLKAIKLLFPETKKLVNYDDLIPIIKELEGKIGGKEKESHETVNNQAATTEARPEGAETKKETEAPKDVENVAKGNDTKEIGKDNKGVENAATEVKEQTDKKPSFKITFEANGEKQKVVVVNVDEEVWNIAYCLATKLKGMQYGL